MRDSKGIAIANAAANETSPARLPMWTTTQIKHLLDPEVGIKALPAAAAAGRFVSLFPHSCSCSLSLTKSLGAVAVAVRMRSASVVVVADVVSEDHPAVVSIDDSSCSRVYSCYDGDGGCDFHPNLNLNLNWKSERMHLDVDCLDVDLLYLKLAKAKMKYRLMPRMRSREIVPKQKQQYVCLMILFGSSSFCYHWSMWMKMSMWTVVIRETCSLATFRFSGFFNMGGGSVVPCYGVV